MPVVTIATDNDGPFRSKSFIALHPELRQVRTRVRSQGRNGPRERGFGTLTCEQLLLGETDGAVATPHGPSSTASTAIVCAPEANEFNRPEEVHLGLADPPLKQRKSCQLLDAGQGAGAPLMARSAVSGTRLPDSGVSARAT